MATRNLITKYNRCINSKFTKKKKFSTDVNPAVILGIETSCDDTAMAIVDSTGKILGEAHNSQLVYHLGEGGVNPPYARDLHLKNIKNVYEDCLNSSNLKLTDIDAIATTVCPGLILPLIVGRDYGVHLSKISNKPFIPIHHMQAHALTARITEKIDFPFLVLLVSGGHCLLTLAESVNQFKILGKHIDNAPGETMDKVARRMKLMNILEYSEISGGNAIELAAKKATNPNQFNFPVALRYDRNCNFSFSGLQTKAIRYVEQEERKHNIRGADLIPDVYNLCAGFLMAITRHLCLRTQRAMEFLDIKKLIPEHNKILVLSGGVASNDFITKALSKVCLEMEYKLVRPPPKLCSDNGVMVAWNGIEKYIRNIDVFRKTDEIDKIDCAHRSPIGENWSDLVIQENIKRKWVKLQFDKLI